MKEPSGMVIPALTTLTESENNLTVILASGVEAAESIIRPLTENELLIACALKVVNSPGESMRMRKSSL
jgi:hypothetical protein